jgi:hypothetical protein
MRHGTSAPMACPSAVPVLIPIFNFSSRKMKIIPSDLDRSDILGSHDIKLKFQHEDFLQNVQSNIAEQKEGESSLLSTIHVKRKYSSCSYY